MSIGAELGQYILQTHNLKNSENSMGVRTHSPNSPSSGYASACRSSLTNSTKDYVEQMKPTPICLLHFSTKLLVYYTIGLKRLFHHFTRSFRNVVQIQHRTVHYTV